MSYIEHHLRPLTNSELAGPVSWLQGHFQSDAIGMATWLCDQLERELPSVSGMPTLDYIIIIGRELNRPQHNVIVIVGDVVDANSEGPIRMSVRIERWVPNEFVGAKAAGYEVFVIA